MNVKSERIGQEEVVLQRIYYPGISLEGMTKTTKTPVRISDFSIKIHTANLPNISVQR
jgi:hypothetical protein